MKNTVIEVSATARDTIGEVVTSPRWADTFRISIYFDYFQDNYHIQFKKGTNRNDVIKYLNNLISLIEEGGKGD
jgi:hypothetical protein